MPITPAVLEWAIEESGLSRAEVAEQIGVAEAQLETWIAGETKPALTAGRKLAATLHRQLAVFLLPAPPPSEHVEVNFRHPIGAQHRRELTPEERRFLRRAKRLQSVAAWLLAELAHESPRLERMSMRDDPEDAGSRWRSRMGVSIADQSGWPSASAAFDQWRSAVERLGITVVQFSMGADACRGFSMWDDRSPLVAVNTAWPDEARSFTLFHEVGHLLTRTDSACATAPMTPHAGDPTERWCEMFAAAMLIPETALSSATRVDNLAGLASLARRMHVSIRAMALRLISLGKASWTLYQAIPPAADLKRRGGAGGTGRNRTEIRVDEFGRRTTELFAAAVRRDVISSSQALDYLDIPSGAFDRLAMTTTAG